MGFFTDSQNFKGKAPQRPPNSYPYKGMGSSEWFHDLLRATQQGCQKARAGTQKSRTQSFLVTDASKCKGAEWELHRCEYITCGRKREAWLQYLYPLCWGHIPWKVKVSSQVLWHPPRKIMTVDSTALLPLIFHSQLWYKIYRAEREKGTEGRKVRNILPPPNHL